MIWNLMSPYTVVADEIETIAYFNGRRIARDHLDQLFFQNIRRSNMQVTDLLTYDMLTPIGELPKNEQAALFDFLEKHNVRF